MKMRLTLLAAAMATLSAPTFAASALELYGKLNVTVQNTDLDTGDTDANADGDVWEAKSNASRLGVKGELGIDDGFSAFYQAEWEVDSTETGGASTPFKSRNIGVGLRGRAGQILVGRWDTPLKLAQGKVDLFNDLDGDIKAIFTGETRASNIVSYSSPKIAGGLVFNVSSILQEKVDAGTPSTENQDGPLDATSISVEWQGSNLFLALAMDQDHNTGTYAEDSKTTRLVATYKLGDFQLGGLYQKQEDGADFDEDGMLLSVAYNVNEDNTIKLQHGESDIGSKGQIGAEGGEQTFLGWDHKLAKNIMVFAFYGEQTFDVLSATYPEKTFLAGGLEVKF
ncbi:porin [Permianibacter sp. IMCC34836]|uniref:porin n=1 Tax=Permianibacter fluminis TaxID=2738515 RepID=UPI00155170E9|nr:porin [Permianibacter fluminis]NQD38467.1 porin [Permianibacter fluminis]